MSLMTAERLRGHDMANFAQVTNDIVTEVIGVSNEVCGAEYPASEPVGQAFIANDLHLTGLWLQTSYNGNFRGCYAGIGYTYDAALDIFVEPPPPEPVPTPEA